MSDCEVGFESVLDDAVKLHGHLGPFLVIGVRMGNYAKRLMKLGVEECSGLRVDVRVPLSTPFSCTIDGIQTTTKCTVGNQKLVIEDSPKEMTATFSVRNSSVTLHVSVDSDVVAELMRKISEGVACEELAAQVASLSEDQLFRIEKR